MGTTAPENTKEVHGVIRVANETIEVITDTAYGDRKTKRSLYPLVLLLVAAAALVFSGGAVPLVGLGLLSLTLLAIWVGGSGR